jgi:endonuclease/exonuclease/phosphatase family metal-dependent hydrolase
VRSVALRTGSTLLLALAAAACSARPEVLDPPLAAACRAAPQGAVGPEARVNWRSAEPSDARRLSTWCAEVGAPLVRLTRPGVPALDSLLVVTWNVYGGGGDLPRFIADLRGGALTGGVPVEHFVLLVQEAFRADTTLAPPRSRSAVPRGVVRHPPGGARRSSILETAEAASLQLFYVPSMRNGVGQEDRGNAILSTLPLRDLKAVELPFEAQRRVAASARIDGFSTRREPWTLRLVNVHLDTRSAGGRFWASAGPGRLRQARSLLEAVHIDGPTVLGGDLNTWSLGPMERALPFLRERFPQTPRVQTGPTFRTSWGYARRLDHVFFNLPDGWSAHYAKGPEAHGSDHFPILAWIRFPV